MVNQGHKTTFFTFLLCVWPLAAWGKMGPQGYFYTQQTHTLVNTRRGGQLSQPAMCLGGKGTNNMQYPETITEGQTRLLNLTTSIIKFL